MTTSAQNNLSDEEASAATADAGFSDVISAWDRVFQGIKAHLRTHASVVSSDIRLSIKAIFVALISTLLLVGIVLTAWASLLVGLVYGLLLYGLHWVGILALVLMLNVVAFVVTKRFLRAAVKSIDLRTTVDVLFHSQND